MRRWISVLYTIPVCITATVLLICVALCVVPLDRAGSASNALFRFWAHTILAICRVRVRYHGRERMSPDARYICMANHSSLIDIPVLVAHTPLRLCFVAKEELFRIPVFGTYLKRLRHIPVARGNSRAAARSMVEAARAVASGSRSVLVFPEGTRSGTGELGEFKEGGALLAIRSGVSLLPLAIAGTSRIWPARSVVITPGIADVYVGEEIPTAGMGPADRVELTSRLRQELASLLDQRQTASR